MNFLKYENIIDNKRNERVNLGDDMQLLAVENLYRYMNINYSDVVRVELSDLYDWGGEELILPISFPLLALHGEKMLITCFSEKIHPVFLGLSILAKKLCEEEVEYLNRYSPIGCRDNYTLEIMKKYNIPAYLFGCLTATLPRRTENEKQTVVYCVDMPNELKKHIPKNILDDSVFLSQIAYQNNMHLSPEETMRERYELLKNTAKMVITSRLHVALPCFAAGIPVVFATDFYSYRFRGIDRLIKIYTSDEYEKIPWNITSVEYENKKKEMLEFAKRKVLQVQEEHNNIERLESILGDLEVKDEIVDFNYRTLNYLKKKYTEVDTFSYSIWAVTQQALSLNDEIKKFWKNACLISVVDRKDNLSIDGIMSKNPKFYPENYTEEQIRDDFLTTRIKIGKKYGFDGKKIFQALQKTDINKINYPDGTYHLITEEDINNDDLWYVEIPSDILVIEEKHKNIVVGNQMADCPILIVEDRKQGITA